MPAGVVGIALEDLIADRLGEPWQIAILLAVFGLVLLAADRRFVAEFHLVGALPRRRRWWLVFEPDAVDLCYRDPGFEVDLFVEASPRVLTQVWLGHVGIDQALREDRLRLDGSRQDVAAFRSWFVLSAFAPAGAEPPGPSAGAP